MDEKDIPNKYRKTPEFGEDGVIKGAEDDIAALASAMFVGFVGVSMLLVAWAFFSN